MNLRQEAHQRAGKSAELLEQVLVATEPLGPDD
jgi:hypothetical protein